ncbi:hypothetical protein [Sphingobacterium faecium]|uniref:hypothetical protein n=1 Tax=Sphingobacterium faecium TaxID=34087 RepID=UPI003207A3FA
MRVKVNMVCGVRVVGNITATVDGTSVSVVVISWHFFSVLVNGSIIYNTNFLSQLGIFHSKKGVKYSIRGIFYTQNILYIRCGNACGALPLLRYTNNHGKNKKGTRRTKYQTV